MLLKATVQVKMIQTAKAMSEADQGVEEGARLKRRSGQQAQVRGWHFLSLHLPEGDPWCKEGKK